MKAVVHCSEAELKTMLCHYHAVETTFGVTATLPHRVTARSIVLHSHSDIPEIADSIGFFDYRIFPKEVMQFYGQWQAEGRGIRVDDIIVQCARLPLGWFKGIFAVKVLDIRRNTDSCVLSYGTLAGHAEQGVSIFTLRRFDQSVSFEIETFSRPALLIARLLGPATRLYQQYCTNLAIANVMQAIQAHEMHLASQL